MSRKNKKAFTLVEVVIVCALFTLILESVYTTLFVGQKSWNNYSNYVLSKQNVRRAFISMCNELREAKNIFITKDEHSIVITFDRPMVGAVAYQWSDSGENAYRILRKNYAKEIVLALDITYLSFELPVDNQLIIHVAAGKNQQFNLMEKITLRSKISQLSH